MRRLAGLDVPLEEASVCVVDGAGAIARGAKVSGDPEALATWLGGLGLPLARAGPETAALAGARGGDDGARSACRAWCAWTRALPAQPRSP